MFFEAQENEKKLKSQQDKTAQKNGWYNIDWLIIRSSNRGTLVRRSMGKWEKEEDRSHIDEFLDITHHTLLCIHCVSFYKKNR